MLSDLGGWHLLIILAVVLLLFGATKLPALSRGIGQSIRIFKSEIKSDETPQPHETIRVADTPAVTPTAAETGSGPTPRQ